MEAPPYPQPERKKKNTKQSNTKQNNFKVEITEVRRQLCNAYTGAKKRNRAEAFPVPLKKNNEKQRNHKFRSQGC